MIYYQQLFDNNGNVLDLLQLPYCLFQDLILKQLDIKKKEVERNKKQLELEKAKDWKKNYRPLQADYL